MSLTRDNSCTLQHVVPDCVPSLHGLGGHPVGQVLLEVEAEQVQGHDERSRPSMAVAALGTVVAEAAEITTRKMKLTMEVFILCRGRGLENRTRVLNL